VRARGRYGESDRLHDDVVFTDSAVTDYDSAKLSDTKRFGRFFHAMLERGIYLPPSQFEALFVSTAHSEEDIERTRQAAVDSFEIAMN